MSAYDDTNAELACRLLLEAEAELERAKMRQRDAYLIYLREGKVAGWSWRRIGRTLGRSEKAMREYWSRHQIRAGRLPDVREVAALAEGTSG